MPDKLYVLVLEDRHIEPEVAVFDDKEKAIEFARELAKNSAHDEDDYEEDPVEGWLFHATYSCEGDCVRVMERELNNVEHLKEE